MNSSLAMFFTATCCMYWRHMGNSLQGKVRQFHILKLEDPVPGNQHILKHGKGVHFIVAAGQGIVIQGLTKVVGLPAYKLQPRRVYGY